MKSASSGDYAATDDNGRDGTRPADASSDVSTDANAHDEAGDTELLPALTPELFVAAGALVAKRVAGEGAGATQVEEVLRRAVDQCRAIAP